MTRPKIVLDCDPGVDDMFALFCALRYCDLVAVTSVAGNVGLDYTTENALAILELAGSDVPVHRGAAGPFNGTTAEDARHVHGETGLGGVSLPAATANIASDDATDALFDLTATGDVTVVAIGPLTNIAHAIERDPTWIRRIPRLVIMGGSTAAGNVTSHAEFNIWADPEAAAVVFDSGISLTMAGLNLTRQVTMGQPEIDAMSASSTPTAAAGAGALDYYSDFSMAHYGVKQSAMHDPCAVLEVVRPELFGREAMSVNIETAGVHTRGMTVCDQRANAVAPDTDVLVDAASSVVVELIVQAAIDPAS
ncbi:nucleoside hydrolase [bacterium]|nr:nucleoside hydrolase [bacterium]